MISLLVLLPLSALLLSLVVTSWSVSAAMLLVLLVFLLLLGRHLVEQSPVLLGKGAGMQPKYIVIVVKIAQELVICLT